MHLDAVKKLHALYWFKVILALPPALLACIVVLAIMALLLVGSALYVAFHREPGEYDWWNDVFSPDKERP